MIAVPWIPGSKLWGSQFLFALKWQWRAVGCLVSSLSQSQKIKGQSSLTPLHSSSRGTCKDQWDYFAKL